MTLVARPTVYRGIQMRSRLEARFAAYLDTMSVAWEYEPNCFADEHGQYLPDFRMSDRDYIEVRPHERGALEAIGRMEIIWSSEPWASLWIVVPDDRLVFHRFPDDPEWSVAEGEL